MTKKEIAVLSEEFKRVHAALRGYTPGGDVIDDARHDASVKATRAAMCALALFASRTTPPAVVTTDKFVEQCGAEPLTRVERRRLARQFEGLPPDPAAGDDDMFLPSRLNPFLA